MTPLLSSEAAAPQPAPPASSPRLGVPLIIALAIVGPLTALVAAAAALHNRPDRIGPDAGPYALGAAIGAISIFPLIACGLFAIGRSFRNRRSQAVIVLACWSISLLSSLPRLAGPSNRELERRDQEIIAEVQARIQELGRQVVESDDLGAQLRFQAEARAALEAALPRLSHRSRPAMLVTLKLLNPLMDDAQAYTTDAVAFMQSPQAQLTTVDSQAEVKVRREKIRSLTDANNALLARLETFDTDAEALLAAEKMSARERANLIAGIKAGMAGRMKHVRDVRVLEARIYEQYSLAFAMLDEEWGRWLIDDEDVIVWDNEELLERFNTIMNEMARLGDEQTEAQRRMFPSAGD